MKKIIKPLVPNFIKILRRHSGGYCKDISKFSGNLLNENLNERQYERILTSLIFENGVRKTTKQSRNTHIIEDLLKGRKLQDGKKISVLDIGASVGLDSYSNHEILSSQYSIDRYVMGDLFTLLYFDEEKKIIFDERGNIIQILLKDTFVNFNFEFRYPIERLYNFFNVRKTNILRKRVLSKVIFDKDKCKKIQLLHPKLKGNENFMLQSMDVFEPIKNKYDLIICLNLLQSRYFDDSNIKKGTNNLLSALNENGVLVLGVTNDYRFLQNN